MVKEDLIQKLNENRKKTLPNFEKIKLTERAVKTVSKLFLHPFCVNTTDLKKFIKQSPVKLSTLSKHILTAFPNTISFYAEKHGKTLLRDQDILDCFAIDHQIALSENEIEKVYSPAYALAHILTVCKTTNLRTVSNNTLADLEYGFQTKKIIFKNAFVPRDLEIKKNQNVFHHFGVIIDSSANQRLVLLAQKLESKQKQIEYLTKVSKQNKETIDFGKPGLYRFDLLSSIIAESKNPGAGKILEKNFKLNLDQNKKIPFSK